jgi:hypothetical protein
VAISGSPSAFSIAARTPPGSETTDRSTKTTPSANSAASLAAVAMARRVLPMPAVPVIVTKRTSSRLRI